MNATHLHLVLNHIPVLGTVFGLLLLAFATWKNSADTKRAALGLFSLAAMAAIPTYLTGEPAEDVVEGLPGVLAALVERHEEAAGVALAGVLVLGVAAVVGLVFFRQSRQMPRWYSMLVLSCALVVSGLLGWAASIGGQIRHTEIQSGAVTAVSQVQTAHHDR